MIRRWLKLRSRVRYWRKRALRAEQRTESMVYLLEAETVRNREREDTFVSAAVMGQRGMWGMPPRTGPVEPKQVGPIAPASWDAGFTGADKWEFETIHLPDAIRAGVSPQKAKQDFARIIASRRLPLNDEGVN